MPAKWETFSEEQLKYFYNSSETYKEFCQKMGYTSSYDALSKKLKEKFTWYKGFNHYKDLTNKIIGNLKVIEKTNKRTSRGNVIWKCQCSCGNICEISSEHLNSQNPQISCGCIKNSYYEQLINDILQQNNFDFKREFTFPDLKGESKLLRFDFAINFNDKIILIEYNGEQHYSTHFYNGTERLNKQQFYDKLKKEYCLKHNIPLIIIPYWDKNKITSEYICNLIKEDI